MVNPFQSGLLNYYNINGKNSSGEIFVAKASATGFRLLTTLLKKVLHAKNSMKDLLTSDDCPDYFMAT